MGKRKSDGRMRLIEDLRKRFEEQERNFNERFKKQENRFADVQNEIKALRADFQSSRSEARKLLYCRMLNAYLNIVKFAKEEPTHPRSIVELRDEARLFSGILEAHKGRGDELNANEIKFLDVFSKINALCVDDCLRKKRV